MPQDRDAQPEHPAIFHREDGFVNIDFDQFSSSQREEIEAYVVGEAGLP